MFDDALDRIMPIMARAFDPAFGEAWNRRQVADALAMGNCRYGLIDAGRTVASGPLEEADDGTISVTAGLHLRVPHPAGFFLARRVVDEEELLLFAIDPDHRRKGLGHDLLRAMLENARSAGMARIFLEMRRGNPAETLYARHGFRPVGLRPGYYLTPAGLRLDAISQELVLDASLGTVV